MLCGEQAALVAAHDHGEPCWGRRPPPGQTPGWSRAGSRHCDETVAVNVVFWSGSRGATRSRGRPCRARTAIPATCR